MYLQQCLWFMVEILSQVCSTVWFTMSMSYTSWYVFSNRCEYLCQCKSTTGIIGWISSHGWYQFTSWSSWMYLSRFNNQEIVLHDYSLLNHGHIPAFINLPFSFFLFCIAMLYSSQKTDLSCIISYFRIIKIQMRDI